MLNIFALSFSGHLQSLPQARCYILGKKGGVTFKISLPALANGTYLNVSWGGKKLEMTQTPQKIRLYTDLYP